MSVNPFQKCGLVGMELLLKSKKYRDVGKREKDKVRFSSHIAGGQHSSGSLIAQFPEDKGEIAVSSLKSLILAEKQRLTALDPDSEGRLVASIEVDVEQLMAEDAVYNCPEGGERRESVLEYSYLTKTREVVFDYRENFKSKQDHYFSSLSEGAYAQPQLMADSLLPADVYYESMFEIPLFPATPLEELMENNETVPSGSKMPLQEGNEGMVKIDYGTLYSIKSREPFPFGYHLRQQPSGSGGEQTGMQYVNRIDCFRAESGHGSVLEALQETEGSSGGRFRIYTEHVGDFGGQKDVVYLKGIEVDGIVYMDGEEITYTDNQGYEKTGEFFLEFYKTNPETGRVEIGGGSRLPISHVPVKGGEYVEIRQGEETESGCGAAGYDNGSVYINTELFPRDVTITAAAAQKNLSWNYSRKQVS